MAIATLVDKHMWLAAAVFVQQLVQLNTSLPMSRVRDQAPDIPGRPEPKTGWSRGSLTAQGTPRFGAERSLRRANLTGSTGKSPEPCSFLATQDPTHSRLQRDRAPAGSALG